MLLDKDKLDNLFNLPDDNTTQPQQNTNVDSVYSELKKLVESGNSVMDSLKYVILSNPEPELVASMASLINVIKDTLKEFTKIHLQNIKHQQQKEIEEIKIKAKKEMLQLKIDETKKLLQNKNGEQNNTNLLAYTQEHVINALNKCKNNEIINITPINK